MRIRIPATTANVGCGYDAFGMALEYYNYLDFEEAERTSINITGQGARYLPLNEHNLILRAAQAVYNITGCEPLKLTITAHNNIPLSRGMGSSSAAIIGGIYAANYLLGKPLSEEELLVLATKLEGHPDNVTPALLGGFTITARSEDGQRVKRLTLPASLLAVLVIPDFPISTKKARTIIPQKTSLTDAIYNLSHAAILAVALAEGDLPCFGAMLKDRLHQPYRFSLIPGAADVVEAARAQGALGCVISGSGPAMIAFHQESKKQGEAIGQAMQQAFANRMVQAQFLQVSMDNKGTQEEKAEKE